ncbi:MAG: L,D-transpeptidase [Caulobacteraceae bacterium]|nr:L,D-transpeptidase [Caulobacteraceae bacterium]
MLRLPMKNGFGSATAVALIALIAPPSVAQPAQAPSGKPATPGAPPAAAPPAATPDQSAPNQPVPAPQQAEPAIPAPSATAPPAEGQPPPSEAPPATVGKGPKAEQVEPKAIENAAFQPNVPLADQPAFLVKLEVFLDRAHNSPGAIDGRPGKNLDHALGIYAHEHGLQPGLNPAVVAALEKGEGGAVTQSYTITEKDEVGPFIGHLPSDFYEQSKLRHMGYTTPEEELAERFHMSQRLLEAMNPGADFAKAGTQITVVKPHSGGLGAQVMKIDVDKTDDEVMAYGADGRLIASFPSTIGSADHPAPSGTYTVAEIRPDPVYIYDPRVLTWGPRRHGRFTIKRGPNNPTGVIWIGLSKPAYGIHGTPNAELIGKTASHGCVRLTNWDAWDLGNAVKPGAEVAFLGQGPQKTASRDNAPPKS